MRKKLKLSSVVSDSGSKKCKRHYGGAYSGIGRSLLLSGVWSQAVGVFGRNLASVAAKYFTFNLLYTEIL
jgi:hypothetical protein